MVFISTYTHITITALSPPFSTKEQMSPLEFNLLNFSPLWFESLTFCVKQRLVPFSRLLKLKYIGGRWEGFELLQSGLLSWALGTYILLGQHSIKQIKPLFLMSED